MRTVRSDKNFRLRPVVPVSGGVCRCKAVSRWYVSTNGNINFVSVVIVYRYIQVIFSGFFVDAEAVQNVVVISVYVCQLPCQQVNAIIFSVVAVAGNVYYTSRK